MRLTRPGLQRGLGCHAYVLVSMSPAGRGAKKHAYEYVSMAPESRSFEVEFDALTELHWVDLFVPDADAVRDVRAEEMARGMYDGASTWRFRCCGLDGSSPCSWLCAHIAK